MDFTVLLNAPVFKGLKSEEIGEMISRVPYKTKKYRPGAMIAQSGTPVGSFMMVLKGVVKGEMIDYSGRVIKIEDIPSPGAIASAFIFGSRNLFPVNVISMTESEILIIEKNDFLNLLKENDKVLTNYLDVISNRSQFLSEKIKFLNFKTIKGKLAQYILQLAGPGNSELRLGITQSEIAEYFGVARPSINRVIREMEDEGIIRTNGRQIKIIDKKKLADLTFDYSL